MSLESHDRTSSALYSMLFEHVPRRFLLRKTLTLTNVRVGVMEFEGIISLTVRRVTRTGISQRSKPAGSRGSVLAIILKINWIYPINYQLNFSEAFRILHEIDNIHDPDPLLGQMGWDIISNQNDLPEGIVYLQERPQFLFLFVRVFDIVC